MGSASCERRMRDLDFDMRFFGTAISLSPSSEQLAKGRKGTLHGVFAAATGLPVAVHAAGGAETPAVVGAAGLHGPVEQQDLPQDHAEV